MSILLCSDPDSAVTQIPHLADGGLVALLYAGESRLAQPLQAAMDDLLVVDVLGPRMSRLNFDAVAVAVIDLPAEMLLSSQGRRLMDALGRLAEEDLILAFVGDETALTGALLEDGVTAGLNLIPVTVVVPAVDAVDELRTLLARLAEHEMRLLAMAAPVAALYDYTGDTVAAHGQGNVLLAGFVQQTGEPQPTARLQILSHGMRRTWPDHE